MKILEVKDLCKNYGKGSTLVKALDEVSFSVEEGEFVQLLVLLVVVSQHYYIF